MKADDIRAALEQVPIVDIHGLIHVRRSLRIARRQCRLGPHPIDIAHDGLGFIQREVTVFDHRHASEGIACEVRLFAMLARPQCCDSPWDPLLLESRQHRARERTTGNGMNDDLGHDGVPTLQCYR